VDENETADLPTASARRASLAFEDFYRAEYRTLVKALMMLGASLQDAEDVVAEVAEEILQKNRWNELDHPRSWCRQAALHKYYDRRERDRQAPFRAVKGGHLTPESRVDIQLSLWEDTQWIGQLLNTLPPAQREVMKLVLDQFKSVEIAKILGKTPDTIRKNLAHARIRLKPHLNGDYRISPGADAEAPEVRKEGDD
jgi:RNA polymerase sigma-70 factor (ECF subfamily)